MIIASAMAVWQDRALNPFAGFLGGGFFIFALAVGVIVLIGCWKVFAKAGQPGWAVLIPIYNAYIVLKIAGRPGWWLLLFLVPVVNIAIGIIVAVDVAKAFGQSAMFGFFLLFLFGAIGYLIVHRQLDRGYERHLEFVEWFDERARQHHQHHRLTVNHRVGRT